MSDADRGKSFRLLSVAVWVFLLTFIHEISSTPAFLEDIWAPVKEDPSVPLVINRIASIVSPQPSSHLLIFEEVPRSGQPAIKLRELRSYEATLLVTAENIEAIRDHARSSPALERVTALHHNPARTTRYAILADNASGSKQQTVYSHSRMLRFALWGTAFIVLIILCAAHYSDRLQAHLSSITVGVVTLVGLFHGVFIYLQGGVIISPMGMLTAAVFPVVLSQTALAYQSRSRARGIKSIVLFLPAATFLISAVIAHQQAEHAVQESVKWAMGDMFGSQYINYYILALILSVLSFAGRTEGPRKELRTASGGGVAA